MDAVTLTLGMLVTFLAAALTVPAGFGLATMLTPIMLLWLDPHLAIAAVAVVHAAHNGWKLVLLKNEVVLLRTEKKLQEKCFIQI